MKKEKESVGEQLYSGAATFGKLWAVVSAIVSTIISIAMLIGGIYIIRHKSHLRSAPGTVTSDSQCSTTYSQQQVTTCRTSVKYTVDGNSYTKTVDSGSTSYKEGNEVTVWYSPSSPGDPELNPPSKTLGWILIVFAFIICIGAWLWVWVTKRSKFAAAAGGTAEFVHLLTGR